MAPRDDEEWSDSDDDLADDVQTAVQLGLPDGPIESADDLRDPSVSRIGGHPTFLSAPHPSPDIAACKSCSRPMHLLVQVWCPLESSPNDRVLYIWACPTGSCQRKPGSVRAWREVRYNAKYAAKLDRRLAKEKEKLEQLARAAAEATHSKAQPKTNPFALGGQQAPNPFGLGAQIFGSTDPSPAAPPEANDGEAADPQAESGSDSEDDESAPDTDDTDLAAAIEAVSLDGSGWSSAPAYTPLYLSTASEYIPPPPKEKQPAGAGAGEDDADSEKRGDIGKWAAEAYENSLDVDQAFERFTKRVGYEAEQCLRYELGGTPLPFVSDKILDQLFPMPAGPPAPVTKAAFMVTPPRKRTYTPEALPACPHCKGQRVFECQIMPNLINVLEPARSDREKKQSDEERLKEVMQALKGESGVERVGMEWGTCMVFSCGKDCSEKGTPGTWREEHLLVQWDV